MSRTADLLNRIELIAHKWVMSVEDVVSILEGKHPTHSVVQKYQELETPLPVNPTVSSATSSLPIPSTASAPNAETTLSNSGNPITPGPAAVSAADQVSDADSIEPSSVGEADASIAVQNQAAAESEASHNED